MPVSSETSRPLTAEAFAAWSEASDTRQELLDGIVVAMGSERAGHARIKGRLYTLLAGQIAERGLPCEAFPDGMAVRVDDDTVFEPDVLVRCGHLLGEEILLVTDPLIVVEVTSPSSRRIDVLVKFARYFRNPSIMHYLIVVPEARIVIHHLRGPSGVIETRSHEDGAIVLDPPGLSLDLAALFGPNPLDSGL